MTISSTASRISYAGNGSTTAFSFPYEFDADSELVVILRTDSDGTEVTKTLTTHYTVSGALNSAGGTVTMLSAPATGTTLSIYRKPPITQDLDLEYNGAIPPTTLESKLDKLTKICQYLQNQLTRCVHVTDGEPGDFDPTLPAVMTADQYLVVNGTGDGFVLAAGGGGGGGGGSGTVTSVAMTVPSFLSVPGTPITTSGTLAVTLQTQVANKIFAGPTTGSDATPTFRALVAADLPALTASRALVTNGSGAIGVSAVTSTELGYVSGVTSAIQTQLDAKVGASAGTLTAGTLATSANFSYATATTVPYLDGSKNLVSSAVTPTELGYLSGVTSAIQTQITALKAGSYTGHIEAGSDKTYVLDEYAAFAYTINSLVTKMASGTVTVAIKINGTDVTSISAHSATSSQVTSTATGANSVAVGDRVTMVFSSSSSPTDFEYTLKYTR